MEDGGFRLRYLWHNGIPANLDILEKSSQAFRVIHPRSAAICLWSFTVQKCQRVCERVCYSRYPFKWFIISSPLKHFFHSKVQTNDVAMIEICAFVQVKGIYSH